MDNIKTFDDYIYEIVDVININDMMPVIINTIFTVLKEFPYLDPLVMPIIITNKKYQYADTTEFVSKIEVVNLICERRSQEIDILYDQNTKNFLKSHLSKNEFEKKTHMPEIDSILNFKCWYWSNLSVLSLMQFLLCDEEIQKSVFESFVLKFFDFLYMSVFEKDLGYCMNLTKFLNKEFMLAN